MKINHTLKGEIEMSKATKFEVLNDIYYNNGIKTILVFREGQHCEGIYYEDGTVTAESPFYYDLVVEVDLKDIRNIGGVL